jgi:glutamate formiminotransferase/formiminotetrahydrofolate cyclodeaminase
MLLDKSVHDFINEIAAATPTPGAGSAAAVAGAMSAALLCMVCRITLNNEKYRDTWESLQEPLAVCDTLRNNLLNLAEEDARAFQAFTDVLHLPRDTDTQREARKAAIQVELRNSSEVPLEIAEKCREVVNASATVAASGAPMALGDVATAVLLAEGGIQGALYSIKSNIPMIKSPSYVEQLQREMREVNDGLDEIKRKTLLLVESRMG